MKNGWLSCAVVGVLIGASGCGGGGAAAGILRDGTNVYSELVDFMSKIVDEESAKKFTELDEKVVNAKWEKLEKRIESFMRFGEEEDVDTLAFLWMGDTLHNKGKNPGPVAVMLKGQKSQLLQRLDKRMKKQSPPKEGEPPLPLAEEDVLAGRVVIKRQQELKDEKSVQHLFEESAAARRLLDRQVARIKGLQPRETFQNLDFKKYMGAD